MGEWQNILAHLRKLSQILGKPFIKATKEDFIELVAKIEKNPKWTEWTKVRFQSCFEKILLLVKKA
jgi:hypothetical protein